MIQKHSHRFSILFAAIFAVAVAPAWTASYYVSTSGNDANPGNLAQPWRNIAHAANTAMPGDTVYIRAGSYTATGGNNAVLRPARSGAAGNPITFRNYLGEVAILEDAYSIVDLTDRNYIHIDGLIIRDVLPNWGSWLLLINSTYCEIRNSSFTFTGPSTGVGWNGIELQAASYNKILNCFISGWGIYGDPYNNGGDAVQLNGGAHHNLVENCFIGSAGHAGLQIDGGYSNMIRNNTFSNPIEKGLEMTNRPNTPTSNFRWNLAEGNTFIQAGYNSELHGGMHIHCNSNYNIIRRNVMRDAGGWGIDMQTWGTDTVSTVGNHFFHNTVVHNGIWQNLLATQSGTGLEITDFGYTGAPQGSHQVKNNIFYDNLAVQGQAGGAGQNVILWLGLETAANRPPAPWFGVVVAGNILYKQAANELVLANTRTGNPNTVAWFQTNHAANVFGNIQTAPTFTAYNTGNASDPFDGSFDFNLQAGSQGIDDGVNLTNTTSAGSGTVVPVADALYFHAGYNGMIAPDQIMVGNELVTVTAIDYTSNTVTVNRSISWANGAGVNLPYSGSAPDIGAYEYGSGGGSPTPPAAPVNLRLR